MRGVLSSLTCSAQSTILASTAIRRREHTRVDRHRVLQLRDRRRRVRLRRRGVRHALRVGGDEHERDAWRGHGYLARVRGRVALDGLDVFCAAEASVALEAGTERLRAMYIRVRYLGEAIRV